jgi:hypothetical protein
MVYMASWDEFVDRSVQLFRADPDSVCYIFPFVSFFWLICCCLAKLPGELKVKRIEFGFLFHVFSLARNTSRETLLFLNFPIKVNPMIKWLILLSSFLFFRKLYRFFFSSCYFILLFFFYWFILCNWTGWGCRLGTSWSTDTVMASWFSRSLTTKR